MLKAVMKKWPYKVMFSLIFSLGCNGISIAQISTPWLTPQGRVCINAWKQLAISRLNSSDLGSSYNERKPWRFSRYGVLVGRASGSNYEPDLYGQYDNQEHWIWAHYNQNSFSQWTGSYSFFNRANIPSCKTYVNTCLSGGGNATTNLSGSSGGAIQTTGDYVGKNERLAGDKVSDWAFPLRLPGGGTVVGISINNLGGHRSIWDTIPKNGYWLTAVLRSGRILNQGDGSVNFTVNGPADIQLFVADNGSLAKGKTSYRITVTYQGGRSVTVSPSNPGLPPANPGAGSITRVLSPFIDSNQDLVGPGEILRGDGKKDWVFVMDLRGFQGNIIGITVRNINGQYSVWDTYPKNGMWLLGVKDPNGNVLNRSDGTVSINATGLNQLILLVHDNGSLKGGKTNFKVVLEMGDGKKIERNVN